MNLLGGFQDFDEFAQHGFLAAGAQEQGLEAFLGVVQLFLSEQRVLLDKVERRQRDKRFTVLGIGGFVVEHRFLRGAIRGVPG